MKSSFFIGFLLLLAACADKKQEKHASSIVANEDNTRDLEKTLTSVDKEEQERQKSLSEIEFERLVHDYGKIVADADYNSTFEFTNTGKKPLLIYDVKTSCGCTVPTWNKNPIPAGAKERIQVTFHPKSHQLGTEVKTVTVLSNTNPGMTVLQIKADVSPPETK
jgi:outer membrane lipoprotein-sorting protein